MNPINVFAVYPSSPSTIGIAIEGAITEVRKRFNAISLKSWKDMNVPGRFISDRVREEIDESRIVLADISVLNFNVTFEVGYAIGRGRPVILVKNKGISSGPQIRDVGIFDTLGYFEYENASDLARELKTLDNREPLRFSQEKKREWPVYLVDTKYKTDWSTRLVSRLKKTRLKFRSFDPNEQPRMSADEAIKNVAMSHGVIVQLLSRTFEDWEVHNLRSAFVIGLAFGMNRVTSIIQYGEEPIPIDYRDFVRVAQHPSDVDEAVAEFVTGMAESLQISDLDTGKTDLGLLARLDLGSSSAENELGTLREYYLLTEQFSAVDRGEVRLIVGRKGSGKTALFLQVRDKHERSRQNVVLDLKPEGYQLLKFKARVEKLLDAGTFEHSLTAIWEYVLFLEIAHKLLAMDKDYYLRDHRITEPYKKLSAIVRVPGQAEVTGDFSERLSTLLTRIADRYEGELRQREHASVPTEELTRLIYQHEFHSVQNIVLEYLRQKNGIWVLIDNLDKGWPTHGVERTDVIVIRTLLDASRKLARDLRNCCETIATSVFLRNDIFELLVRETPDRGKESQIVLDWKDADLLRELLKRRFVYNGMDNNKDFEFLWQQICLTYVDGEESSQYLIDRSLMRPRYLINLINYCKSNAVNLKHTKIEAEDIQKGLKIFSNDIVSDINFEIADINPKLKELLYALMGSEAKVTDEDLITKLSTWGVEDNDIEHAKNALMWHGVLGLDLMNKDNTEVRYIHDFLYDFPKMRACLRMNKEKGFLYEINPAFHPGLDIEA